MRGVVPTAATSGPSNEETAQGCYEKPSSKHAVTRLSRSPAGRRRWRANPHSSLDERRRTRQALDPNRLITPTEATSSPAPGSLHSRTLGPTAHPTQGGLLHTAIGAEAAGHAAIHANFGLVVEDGRGVFEIINQQTIRRGSFDSTACPNSSQGSGARQRLKRLSLHPCNWTKTAYQILPHATPGDR